MASEAQIIGLSPYDPTSEDDVSYIDALIQATLNEKNSPEILPVQQDLLSRLQQKLQEQEQHVEALEANGDQELRTIVYKMEIRRVRFLVKSYYRTRLHKIEKYAANILSQDEVNNRLTELERQYASDYFIMLGRHLKETVLDYLPHDFKPLVKLSASMSTSDDLILHPMLDKHVFCKLLDEVGPVTVNGSDVVDMHKDDLFIIRYEAVACLVHASKAVLI